MTLIVFTIVFGLHANCSCQSVEAFQGGDNFDGAIWYFKITPRTKGAQTLSGQFRVSDHILYQKELRSSEDFTKRVGVNHPNGNRTRVEITDLRAKMPNGEFRSRINGEVRMTFDKFGKWSGMFTDERGINWDFNCTRVKE